MALILSSRPGASNDRDWVLEYARTASVEWHGNFATLRNIRNFTYRTRDDYTPAYYDAIYDVNDLQSVDLIVSHWAGANIAHVFLSFGFGDGRHLAVSIETRRTKGQKYSKFGGFLKNYSLIYVVADERDLIGVRTDVRRERVHLYSVDLPVESCRALFLDYLLRIDGLNHRAEFYHTLFNNCTTNILRHARVVSSDIRYSWKVLLSGYADHYCYQLGVLDRSAPFPALKARSLIRRPAGAVIDGNFSVAIRQSAP